MDSESIKPFTSRNLEYDTALKPAIAEDPEEEKEETKSDKGLKEKEED